MKPNWPAATRWTASPEPCNAFNDALSRRSRLAGEEALKPCIAPSGAYIGQRVVKGSVDQSAGHDQGVFATAYCRVVVAAAPHFIEAITLV